MAGWPRRRLLPMHCNVKTMAGRNATNEPEPQREICKPIYFTCYNSSVRMWIKLPSPPLRTAGNVILKAFRLMVAGRNFIGWCGKTHINCSIGVMWLDALTPSSTDYIGLDQRVSQCPSQGQWHGWGWKVPQRSFNFNYWNLGFSLIK